MTPRRRAALTIALLAAAGCGATTHDVAGRTPGDVGTSTDAPSTDAVRSNTTMPSSSMPPTTSSPSRPVSSTAVWDATEAGAPTTDTATTMSTSTTSSTTSTPTTTTTSSAPVRSGATATTVRDVGVPTRVVIESIGVDHEIVPTGVLADGTVDVPIDPWIAGWFAPGPRPGEIGPAVVMGHVDSRSYGPGVFYRLRELAVGDRVVIVTESGAVEFETRSVEQFAKDEFPTDRVYGSTPGATLRLITCGGSFDSSVRSYRDNVVAFLVQVPPS